MKFTVDALPETLKTFFKEKRDGGGSNISCEEAKRKIFDKWKIIWEN